MVKKKHTENTHSGKCYVWFHVATHIVLLLSLLFFALQFQAPHTLSSKLAISTLIYISLLHRYFVTKTSYFYFLFRWLSALIRTKPRYSALVFVYIMLVQMSPWNAIGISCVVEIGMSQGRK